MTSDLIWRHFVVTRYPQRGKLSLGQPMPEQTSVDIGKQGEVDD